MHTETFNVTPVRVETQVLRGVFYRAAIWGSTPPHSAGELVLAQPFSLPPPSAKLYFSLQRVCLTGDMAAATAALQTATRQAVLAHVDVRAVIRKTEHSTSTLYPRIRALPAQSTCDYILLYPIRTSLLLDQETWDYCIRCEYKYDDHVDGVICPGRLGESFHSGFAEDITQAKELKA